MSEQLQLEDEAISITLRRAWDRALRVLSTRVNTGTFEAHMRRLKPLSLTEEMEGGVSVFVVTLGAMVFTREWVENRHGPLIQSILEEIFDHDVRLRFSVLARERGATAPLAPAKTPSLFDDSDDEIRDDTGKPAGAAAPTASGSGKRRGGSLRDVDLSREDSDDDSLALFSDPRDTPAARSRRADLDDSDFADSAPGKPQAAPRPVRQSPESARNAPEPVRSSQAASDAHSAGFLGKGGGRGSSSDAPSLNSRYTFDSFVVGRNNRLAHAGALAVAQAPGEVYNPLFLYGTPGLGKTHLMHAIGHEIAHKSGGNRVAFITGEVFTSNFVASLREKRGQEFRRRWRSVDVLLIDDIQFIASKEQTKEEFFHVFNELYQTGKQIVITSDRSPRELRAMDERLRSRFECGLIADIAPPDLETRLAILHKKADAERMRIPDEVLLYMARLVQSNIRTLEGALVKLIAYASLVNSPVTTQLASDVLERYFISAGIGGVKQPGSDDSGGERDHPDGVSRGSSTAGSPFGKSAITAEVVQRVVAKRFGLSADALLGKRRDKEVSHARQVAMHLMRELTEMSLPGIGQQFGGRDHSTVSHACERIRSLLPFDDDLRSLIADMITQVRAQAAGE